MHWWMPQQLKMDWMGGLSIRRQAVEETFARRELSSKRDARREL